MANGAPSGIDPTNHEPFSEGSGAVAEGSGTDDRVWRAVDQHRARALHELYAVAANALGDLFPSRRRAPSASPDLHLARMLARDLTALGMVVPDSSTSVTAGGVW